MTWFRVDDTFHAHPKALATEPAALGLWVVAGAWSGAHLTEGFVPDHVLPRLLPDSAELARKLVAAGLWRRVRGGYRFHDWADYNPTAEAVRAMREKRAAAGRIGGLSSGKARSKREANASGIVEPPARPVPPPTGERDGGVVRKFQRPWCGRCNKENRLATDDEDRTVRCPRCHPERRSA